jgi:hypothetical protein
MSPLIPAEWTGQQLREAFPFDQVPRYLLRDRDGIFGFDFTRQVKALRIKEVLSVAVASSDAVFLFRVLLRSKNAFVALQGRPDSSARAANDAGTRHCNCSGGRPASPVQAPRRLIFARALWLQAECLRHNLIAFSQSSRNREPTRHEIRCPAAPVSNP